MAKIKLSFVGDVLIHDSLLRKSRETADPTFGKKFEKVREQISISDLSIANLESIAAGEKFGIAGYPRFNAPTELLAGLKNTGFDILNVANNHMLDKGEEALIASIANIKKAGMDPVGAIVTGAGEPYLVKEVQGIKVGFLSFTDGAKIKTTLIKGTSINYFAGENEPVRMFNRLREMRKQIKALRLKADIVILQVHYGEEYLRYPSSFQRELITMVCESDVDVVIGHHPHVLQPAEWIENSRGRKILVHYSLGNFFSGQLGIHRQIGGIFSFTVETEKNERDMFFSISDPEIRLTFVDSRADFEIKYLQDVIKEKDLIHSYTAGALNSKKLYEDVRDHGRTYMPGISII